MSDSLSTQKWSVVIHAIAITAALAVISGYAPSSFLPLTRLQALLQSHSAAPHH